MPNSVHDDCTFYFAPRTSVHIIRLRCFGPRFCFIRARPCLHGALRLASLLARADWTYGPMDAASLWSLRAGASMRNGICGNQRAIIVSDNGKKYESYPTLAHEIAHTMGVPHDGEDSSKSCPASQLFLMSPKASPKRKLTFSPCSKDAINKFLKTLQVILENCAEERCHDTGPDNPSDKLGANHDGTGYSKACPPVKGYLMYPDAGGVGPMYSECSRVSINVFLNGPTAKCLFREGYTNPPQTMPNPDEYPPLEDQRRVQCLQKRSAIQDIQKIETIGTCYFSCKASFESTTDMGSVFYMHDLDGTPCNKYNPRED
ncbi:uncharacterized protein LOC119187166 isoform X2 [Rhipicephalus microplus]|uniref:uncharacterized protein LOC119187166 isoform X2 n=1 Tax=Rhipicephalus microplus TaxID=6941 RepID=UPI003F6C4C18